MTMTIEGKWIDASWVKGGDTAIGRYLVVSISHPDRILIEYRVNGSDRLIVTYAIGKTPEWDGWKMVGKNDY